MFCTKCGRQIADDAVVCDYCGAKVGEAVVDDNTPVTEVLSEKVNDLKEKVSGNPDLKKIVLGALAVVILLVLVLVCSLMFGSSPKKTVEKYAKAAGKLDYVEVMKYTVTNKKALKALDLYDEDYYEEMVEQAEDQTEEMKDKMEEKDIEIKIKADVKDVEKFKKSDDEFEWVCEYLEDTKDADVDKVKGVAEVKVRVKETTYEDGDKEGSETSTTKMVCVKLSGNWYIIPGITMEALEKKYDD